MRLPLLTLTLGLLCASQAVAEPITYTFTGAISETAGNHFDFRMPNTEVGSAITGFITLDADTATEVFSVTFPDYTFTRGTTLVHAFTDEVTGADRFHVNEGTWGISVGDGFFRGEHLLLRMVDPTGTALTSTDIYQDLSGFQTGTLRFLGQSLIESLGEDSLVSWTANIDTWTRVPEPGTLTLLGIAVCAMRLRQSRTRARQS